MGQMSHLNCIYQYCISASHLLSPIRVHKCIAGCICVISIFSHDTHSQQDFKLVNVLEYSFFIDPMNCI